MPERFEGLDSAEAKKLDPTNFIYGFGRRLVCVMVKRFPMMTVTSRRCPGNHFAHASVWCSMVGLLALFVISPDIDENGHEIPIKAEFTPGAIRYIVRISNTQER